MPIYEFECNFGHRIEKIFSISECPERIVCQTCTIRLQVQDEFSSNRNYDGIGCEKCGGCFCHCELEIVYAEKVWSIPGNIQIGQPTRMFINTRTGEPFSPISKYDKPPKGYREIELKNPVERAKFEKQQQQRVDAENQLTSHVLDSMKSEARKNRHDNLKARMNAVQREEFTNQEGKIETMEFTLDHKEKALIEKAMNRSKKRPAKEKKSNVMLAANHYDRSNMDEVK